MEFTNLENALKSLPIKLRETLRTAIIFQKRCSRLIGRYITIIDDISVKSSSDIHTKANLNLLLVTGEDIFEYLQLLSQNSFGLTAHLLKYGSDKERFYKWNQRLRLITIFFKLDHILELFDGKLDVNDTRSDLAQLRTNLAFISSNKLNQEGIVKILDYQEKNPDRVLQIAEGGDSIDPNSINYIRVLGAGDDDFNT